MRKMELMDEFLELDPGTFLAYRFRKTPDEITILAFLTSRPGITESGFMKYTGIHISFDGGFSSSTGNRVYQMAKPQDSKVLNSYTITVHGDMKDLLLNIPVGMVMSLPEEFRQFLDRARELC